MFFAYIYDNNYIKSDRDFYGDAIICFYPVESKESYLYLLGQMVGAIEFFKGLIPNSRLEQFKLDKLIFCFKSLNSQFSMIIATDQMTLSNELLIRKKLAILFNLVKLIHGPFSNIDRTDETNYKLFKKRIDDITSICYNLVIKTKRSLFDSFYATVNLNLQVKLESRSKYLMNYSMKKLKAFTGLLFYNDRVFSTSIKTNLMINLLYLLLTNEETNLLEKCVPVNESLSLPVGCHLVKFYLPRRLINRLINETYDANRDNENKTNEEDLNESNETSDDYIVMDVLPETTRFRTTISMSSVNEFDRDDLNETNSFNLNDSENDHEVTLYFQKNSKLKLALMSLETKSECFQSENLIRIWQNIVTNFSTFECELMEEERRLVQGEKLRKDSINEINSNLVYSCVIDRNQMIKNNWNVNKNTQSGLMSNMNLYNEIFKSIPELSKLEISKKSYTYSYIKQNIATISSSTLHQYSLNESINDGNVNKVDFEIIDKTPSSNLNLSSSSSLKSSLNYGDVLIRCTQNKFD